MPSVANDVQFDFEGSLDLARRLWSLAEDLGAANGRRLQAAALALARWEGTYAVEFQGRATDEDAGAVNTATGMQEEALAWAYAWKTAMDEQNVINRRKAVQAEREQRSALEVVTDFLFTGDDSEQQVAAANEVAVPQPPSFTPTDELQVF